MSPLAWSWLLTAVGLTGFILAGRKVWWCWWVNVACQGLWFTYAIVTHQWGFIVASVVYTVVFTQNALRWTREHRAGTLTPASTTTVHLTCPHHGCRFWVDADGSDQALHHLSTHWTEAHP